MPIYDSAAKRSEPRVMPRRTILMMRQLRRDDESLTKPARPISGRHAIRASKHRPSAILCRKAYRYRHSLGQRSADDGASCDGGRPTRIILFTQATRQREANRELNALFPIRNYSAMPARPRPYHEIRNAALTLPRRQLLTARLILARRRRARNCRHAKRKQKSPLKPQKHGLRPYRFIGQRIYAPPQPRGIASALSAGRRRRR